MTIDLPPPRVLRREELFTGIEDGVILVFGEHIRHLVRAQREVRSRLQWFCVDVLSVPPRHIPRYCREALVYKPVLVTTRDAWCASTLFQYGCSDADNDPDYRRAFMTVDAGYVCLADIKASDPGKQIPWDLFTLGELWAGELDRLMVGWGLLTPTGDEDDE